MGTANPGDEDNVSSSVNKTPDECLQLGLDSWNTGTSEGYASAKDWLTKAAAANHPRAAFLLGTLYESAFGDLTEASRWFYKAFELGNVAAANSLIYSVLIPAKDWAKIEQVVKEAVAANEFNESTNAVSNGAIAKYLEGKTQEAIDGFSQAISREDHFADDEASWFLSMIYNQLGDTQNEQKYRKICSDLGGYSKPDFVEHYEDVRAGEVFKPGESAPIFEKVRFLWSQLEKEGDISSASDEVFLGVNYAELASRGDAKLTKSGSDIVEAAYEFLSNTSNE